MGKTRAINLGNAKGRRSLDKVDGFATSIGPDVHFVGEFSGDGHCVVHGRVEGVCRLSATLVIGEEGVWQGDIIADDVLVAGRVEGTIIARNKLEIVSTARLTGSLNSPVIAIAEGAIHEGEIHMGDVQHFTDRRQTDS